MTGLDRRMGRLAAAATAGAIVVAATGVAVAGSAPGPVAGGTKRVSVPLAYTCRFPSGVDRVGVRVAGGFPATGTVGRAIQPAGVHVTITVPQPALRDLGRAATVRATDSLRVAVAEGRASASAAWRGVAARPTPLPATGNLVLTASGPVPPTTASAPGQVSFTADGMHLVLSPRTANGAATSPVALAIPCRLNPGQDAQIAVVTVAGPSPLPVPSHLPGLGRRHSITVGRIGAASHPSKKCFLRVKLPGIGSAFVAGYADVSKLREAALLGPGPDNHPRAGLSDVRNVEQVTDICQHPLTVYQYAIGELNYHGKRQFPPATATFLNFRFVPVTATLVVSLVPSDCRDIAGHLVAKTGLCIAVTNPSNTTAFTTTITSEERIRVASLRVNGVPLPAGQNCHTVRATKVTFHGSTKLHYSLEHGGPLQAFVKVPQFTGCGVGENLDPLLNASVSSSGNYALLTQGPLCEKFPHIPANHNCRIPPGAPGYPYGFPKFYPKLRRHV